MRLTGFFGSGYLVWNSATRSLARRFEPSRARRSRGRARAFRTRAFGTLEDRRLLSGLLLNGTADDRPLPGEPASYAATSANGEASLAVGLLTVRTAYVVPSNRTAQASAVANLQDYLPRLRDWYAEQLDRWGFPGRTLTYETLPDGVTPEVQVVHVGVTDAYLREDVWGHTIEAAAAAGVTTWATGEVWLLFSEAQVQNADGSISGGTALGASWGSGSDPGIAMLGGDALFRMSSARLLDDGPYAGEIGARKRCQEPFGRSPLRAVPAKGS